MTPGKKTSGQPVEVNKPKCTIVKIKDSPYQPLPTRLLYIFSWFYLESQLIGDAITSHVTL